MYTNSIELNATFADYEATVATGLETIAKDEVLEKLGVEATTQRGRIWFKTDCSVEKLLRLKTISNLFIVIYNEFLDETKIPNNASELEPLFMEVADKCDWKIGLSKWVEMSKFDCPIDKIMTKDLQFKLKQPKFRVSSNRFGPKHNFTSPEICSVFGHVVDAKFGWPIKMKDYDLQIYSNFNENHLYICFTLSTKALDCRNIISTGLTTLKAPTCYALLRIAKLNCGDIVCDPMAGSGAIPVECSSGWNNREWFTYTIAGELFNIPLNKCKLNLDSIENGKPPYDILQLNVTSMPFKENSIDVFISDLPFGKRHGSKKQNKTLYPALLKDMGRVARLETGRAVLLTQDFNSMNLAHKSCEYWTQRLCSFVKIGNLNCYIYLFVRNNNKFHEV